MGDINHCVDCCCAQSWKALGITEYTGKSIPEHIKELRKALLDIKSEVLMEMGCAEHKKRLAEIDSHRSEVNHQDGRWHCANDLCEYIEKIIKKLDGFVD